MAPVRLWAPFIVQQTGEIPRDTYPQTILSAYGWWHLTVLLLAPLGLLMLSRVRLSVVPVEVVEGETPAAGKPKPLVPTARLVRRSPIVTLPQEIALVHDDTLIGSDRECDVILPHSSIARRHVRVQRRKQGYVLLDLRSTYGTSVNGRPIAENLLKKGWIVRLGEVEFVFHETSGRA